MYVYARAFLTQNLSCLNQVAHFLAVFHFVADSAAHVLLLGKVLDVGVVEGVLNLFDGALQGRREGT